MHRYQILVFALLLVALPAQASSSSTEQMVAKKMNLMPLSFTQNDGQWDERVLFRCSAGGATFWFTNDRVVYQFTRSVDSENTFPNLPTRGELPAAQAGVTLSAGKPPLRAAGCASDGDSLATMSISASFVGANPSPRVVGEGLTEYRCNYFVGNERSKWRTDVPNYKAVIYKDIYPGMDLKYYGNGDGKLEYDFIIQPGADPSQIAVRYDGAKEVRVDATGQLVVETAWGDVIERSPFVYQLVGGERREISAEYCLRAEGVFGFGLDDSYEPTLATVIDPVLNYGTYLGGGIDEWCNGIVVDDSGYVYLAGRTLSTDFPTQNPYQPTNNAFGTAYVAKLTKAGDGLIYSTYLGGSNDDAATAISIDDSGSAYVAGWTVSNDFPTQNPYQATFQGSYDVFIARLNRAGNALLYSTYFGGSALDQSVGIAVDHNRAAHVTGYTTSTNLPTQNPYQATKAGSWLAYDAFVVALDSTGSSLVYSTYLGGTADDFASGIVVDDSGNAYITGRTSATNFPTQGGLQATYQGGGDAFVTKLSSVGDSLVYSTYLGGTGNDRAYALALDHNRNAYVLGVTLSTDFPLRNPYQATNLGTDLFVAKLNSNGDSLLYATYLGGSASDGGCAIAVDDGGHACITGATMSTDFPMVAAHQPTHHGKLDAFVSKLSAGGNSLIYSTYLGDIGDEEGAAIAVNHTGAVYVAGWTKSSAFPIHDPYQTTNHGTRDAFLVRLQDILCGDLDASGIINISDAVYLVNYIFGGGPAPLDERGGDVDCNNLTNVSDAVYMINYIFAGGAAPCAACK
jgi:hypothetical protein